MHFDFSQRRALVTGGTGGLGGAISRQLAAFGCEVIATGLSAEEVARFDTEDRSMSTIVLDVTDDRQVHDVVAGLGRLDILINAAGTILRNGREFELIGFQDVLNVNLTGTMRVTTACHPLLKQSRGCILNLASMLTYFGSGFAPGYSASKGGVAQLTKSLAIAWAAEGIRVNAIAPGWIETELTGPLYRNPTRSEQILSRTPMNRWGKPEDVTGAACFLCSPAAAFITGVILPVDGGYSVA